MNFGKKSLSLGGLGPVPWRKQLLGQPKKMQSTSAGGRRARASGDALRWPAGDGAFFSSVRSCVGVTQRKTPLVLSAPWKEHSDSRTSHLARRRRNSQPILPMSFCFSSHRTMCTFRHPRSAQGCRPEVAERSLRRNEAIRCVCPRGTAAWGHTEKQTMWRGRHSEKDPGPFSPVLREAGRTRQNRLHRRHTPDGR